MDGGWDTVTVFGSCLTSITPSLNLFSEEVVEKFYVLLARIKHVQNNGFQCIFCASCVLLATSFMHESNREGLDSVNEKDLL